RSLKTSIMTFGAGNDQEFIGKLKQLTLDHLADERFGGKELAVAMGMSWSTLNRKLQALTGQHISQFIREIRLQKALELLQEKNATASEVAYKVGFGGPAYFNKCFNAYFGFPPGEVKKRMEDGTLPLADENQPADVSFSETTSNSILDRFPKPYLIAAFAGLALLIIALGMVFLAKKGDSSFLLQDHEKSIAVLPFKNLSGEADNQYFADGITEDILNHLFRISELRVISRTTAERFRDSELPSPEIAKSMGVNYLLEGSVRKQGEQVRITVQLIDGKSDRHLWSENYDRQLADIFLIQSDIAQKVARELRAVLSPKEIETIEAPYTKNPEAYDHYLMGRFYWYKMGPENIEKSIEYFERAIALDHEFALAYAYLAYSYLIMVNYQGISLEEGLTLSESFAQKALDINPDLPDAYLVLGEIKRWEWKWEESRSLLARALNLNPNDALTINAYGAILAQCNETEEAHKYLDIAINLEPFQPIFLQASTFLHAQEGNYQKAYEIQLKSLELAGSEAPWDQYWNLYATCIWLNREKEALEYLEKFFESFPELIDHIEKIDTIYQKSGIHGILRWVGALLIENNFIALSAENMAEFYAYIDKKDSVLYWLEKSYENREVNLPLNIVMPYFKPYSSDPRFKAIVEKTGMAPYYYKDQN
ncbi:MAG: helix-turn-helix domain-containing protein, partial [Lentimicrobium sp.]|nr:helix-turn-helix domain-containing protein [Lentimicrobium sp.]